MNFTTPVTPQADGFTLHHSDVALLLGSCFAQNMGERMVRGKLQVDVNPFGILYNPLSVAEALERVIQGREVTPEELFFHNNQWNSFGHHSHFSHPEQARCLELMNGRLLRAAERMPQTNRLLITWGTAFLYRLADGGRVVANCHKLPESHFHRSRLSVEEIVAVWRPLIEKLVDMNPSVKILFTVSPIRHLRDGAHGNQLSKATLLLAVEELCKVFPHCCCYFPSYEIVLDELRDYRFYADDMAHPSPLAIEYLWQRFSECCFSPQTRQVITHCERLHKLLSHRSLSEDKSVQNSFLLQKLSKIEETKEKYPYLDFERELESLRNNTSQ